MPKVLVESRPGGCRVVRLNDPERRNAIDRSMRDELAEAARAIDADEAARVVVITGNGTAFCAGGNLRDLLGGPGRPIDELREDLIKTYDSFLSFRALRIPSIAVVNGPAVGAGANLALCCDIRIIGSNGYFSFNFAKLGIHPGGGATWFLTSAIGASGAMEILLRGDRVGASDAVARGLAAQVSDNPLATGLELAETICALDPTLVRDIKSTVRTAEDHGLAHALRAESWAQASSISRNPAILTPPPPGDPRPVLNDRK